MSKQVPYLPPITGFPSNFFQPAVVSGDDSIEDSAPETKTAPKSQQTRETEETRRALCGNANTRKRVNRRGAKHEEKPEGRNFTTDFTDGTD
jgi:hypothetical protein